MEAETVCCLLCNASVLCFIEVNYLLNKYSIVHIDVLNVTLCQEGGSKLKQHMRFEHGVAFNMQFMVAACRYLIR